MISQSLNRAFNEFRYQSRLGTPASEMHEYDNRFSRGFLFGSSNHESVIPEGWRKQEVAEGVLYSDPALAVKTLVDGDSNKSLYILGHSFWSRQRTYTTAETASELFRSALRSGEDFLDYLETLSLELSGRFVILGVEDSSIRVLPDPMASLSCFYSTAEGSTVIGSHSFLVATAVGDTSNEACRWVMTNPDYHSPGGKYLPATVTAHDKCKQLHGNCALAIENGRPRHYRIYPNSPLGELTLEEAADIVTSELRFQTEAWSQVSRQNLFALTGGLDSRSILNSCLDILKKYEFMAMTYHFFAKDHPGTRVDLLKANQLAVHSRLPHQIVSLESGTISPRMAKLYGSTFPSFARFPSLADAFYTQLPSDAVLVFGIGGEIGTVFFQERGEVRISPELLAKKFSPSKIGSSDELIRSFGEYIAHTEFYEEKLFGYDFYDLFYWEHRLTKWASLGYAEYDLSIISALPMNSRRFFEAMLSLPFDLRQGKSIYDMLEQRAIGQH